MENAPQGIPALPDLTHPNELIEFGAKLLNYFLTLALLVIALGIILALISFTLRRNLEERGIFLQPWLNHYSNLVRSIEHGIVISIFLVAGFFLCSTLANRYHYWEQQRITQVAATVSGDRLEQPAPKIRYTVKVPYSYLTQNEGKTIKVEDIREETRFIALKSSEIKVKIDRLQNRQDNSNNYKVDFSAIYQVKNTLPERQDLFFEISPPYSYTLLQNFAVERDSKRIEPTNPGEYSFPLTLRSNQSSSFRVTYQAQGAPRWVYSASGELLSNFRLSIDTTFPNADFASGIAPTETTTEGRSTIFTWIFEDNVSVANPFGVFTATAPIRNTGVISRLLLLAPGIFLWWLLLLYFSIPLTIRNIALISGLFFACLLALTYISRIGNPQIAWGVISLLLLILIWGLGANRRGSLAVVICTIAGAIVPVFGLLIPYSGLTLSIAGLLSIVWLALRNWYDL